jgi:hypothetical protein
MMLHRARMTATAPFHENTRVARHRRGNCIEMTSVASLPARALNAASSG